MKEISNMTLIIYLLFIFFYQFLILFNLSKKIDLLSFYV